MLEVKEYMKLRNLMFKDLGWPRRQDDARRVDLSPEGERKALERLLAAGWGREGCNLSAMLTSWGWEDAAFAEMEKITLSRREERAKEFFTAAQLSGEEEVPKDRLGLFYLYSVEGIKDDFHHQRMSSRVTYLINQYNLRPHFKREPWKFTLGEEGLLWLGDPGHFLKSLERPEDIIYGVTVEAKPGPWTGFLRWGEDEHTSWLFETPLSFSLAAEGHREVLEKAIADHSWMKWERKGLMDIDAGCFMVADKAYLASTFEEAEAKARQEQGEAYEPYHKWHAWLDLSQLVETGGGAQWGNSAYMVIHDGGQDAFLLRDDEGRVVAIHLPVHGDLSEEEWDELERW